MLERVDWQAATKQVAVADGKWLQSLSVEDSIQLYFSFARFALSQRDESEGWKNTAGKKNSPIDLNFSVR